MASNISWEDDESGELLTLRFDVTTSAEHEDTSTLTDHPVERGSAVTDSAREEPERLTLEGVVTNIPHEGNPGFSDVGAVGPYPIQVEQFGANETYTKKVSVPDSPVQPSPSGLIQAGVGALGKAVFGGPNRNGTFLRQGPRSEVAMTATTVSYGGSVDRVRDAYELLLLLRARRARCVVTTGLREYFDMVFERVHIVRSAEEGDYGKFSVDLRRVITVTAETVEAPRPAEARGVAGKSKGSQAAKDGKGEGKRRLRSTIKTTYAGNPGQE